ncbi:MAG: OmpH family outer membrane protein [Bacteroidota bacterium]
MKLKTLFAIFCFGIVFHVAGQAQVKIGYTNIELVLAYMPEAKAMEKSIGTFQKKLAEKIKVKDDYVKQKYQEYLQLKEQGGMDQAEQERREKELLRLDQEVQKLAADSEYDLLAKRQELLEPILKKLQGALDAVAAEDGYTYIMNQTTSAGVSTILVGPDENDVTEKLFAKLGMKMPSE